MVQAVQVVAELRLVVQQSVVVVRQILVLVEALEEVQIIQVQVVLA